MNIAQTIDGNTDRSQPGFGSVFQTLIRQMQCTALHCRQHSVRFDFANYLKPIVAKICFATDQRYLSRAEFCKLTNQVECLCRRQLVTSHTSRPRSAMMTFQIAGKSYFPDNVNRSEI